MSSAFSTRFGVRTSSAGSDVLSRHTSDLLAAMLSGLVAGTSRDAVVTALEERHRGLPKSSQSMLQPTLGRLILLVDYCARTAAEERPACRSRSQGI